MMNVSYLYDGTELSFDGYGKKGKFPFGVPDSTDPLKDDEYECCFLCSNYFVTEGDYYKVNLKGSDGAKNVLGWIFPFNLLTEDTAFYTDVDEYLLKYMHVGIHKLVDYSLQHDLWKNQKGTIEDLSLSSDLILLVYRNRICSKERFQDLIPSLFDFGYHVIDNPAEIDLKMYPINTYRKEKAIEFKHDPAQTCINLRCVSPLFSGSEYVKTLFKDTLISLRDPFLKYFSLYQIVEILMRVVYCNRYFEYVEKYANDDRHDLIDRFGELSSESKLIKKIYEIGESGTEYLDFIDAAKKLLKKMDEDGIKDGSPFDDYMYKIRNLIVHNLRVMHDYEKDMTYLSYMYETLIVDLMCRTNLSREEDKQIYVIDRTKSRKANRKAFGRVMNGTTARK